MNSGSLEIFTQEDNTQEQPYWKARYGPVWFCMFVSATSGKSDYASEPVIVSDFPSKSLRKLILIELFLRQS